MKPDISEFSYGFALTHELVSRYGYTATPEFPSLRKEGAIGGYDVRLRGKQPLFIQFKTSDYLVRRSAIAAGQLGVPHYRAQLRATRHSDQHNLLLTLESKGYEVFYAAPMFHQPGELDDAFRYRNMVARSAFFRPSHIGALTDDEEHSLSFVRHHLVAYLNSDPKKLRRLDGISLFRNPRSDATSSNPNRPSRSADSALDDLRGMLVEFGVMPGEASGEFGDAGSPADRMQRLATLSRLYIGAEVLFR